MVGGNATIQATEVKNGITSDKFFIIPANFGGVAAASGVGTDDVGDLLTNVQGALENQALTAAESLVKTFAGDADDTDAQTETQAPNFQAAGAVAIDLENNTATAFVAPDAILEDPGSATANTGTLTIDANINDRPAIVASGGVTAQTGMPAKAKRGTSKRPRRRSSPAPSAWPSACIPTPRLPISVPGRPSMPA